METIKLYAQRLKEWTSKHPMRFAFLLGVVTGFIIRTII
jgi:hypothetical protein